MERSGLKSRKRSLWDAGARRANRLN